MNTKVKSTFVPQSYQPGADSELAGQDQEKAPVLHVQTAVRAGGFYDWWFSMTENFNQSDRNNQGV